MEDKFCVDCEHFWWPVMRCNHEAARSARNMVTGEFTLLSCDEMRDADGACGPHGRHFEARKPLPPPSMVRRECDVPSARQWWRFWE
jgi:hypothetical protein